MPQQDSPDECRKKTEYEPQEEERIFNVRSHHDATLSLRAVSALARIPACRWYPCLIKGAIYRNLLGFRPGPKGCTHQHLVSEWRLGQPSPHGEQLQVGGRVLVNLIHNSAF